MKKVLFVCTIALAALFVACEGNTKTEDVGVGATKGVEALEALSTTESDTTTFACTCGHKCKTKEECEKNCGEDCEMVKK
ncbi:MAG: hypothetical protein Q8M29_13325 [Bacteroidota bacterium]|nr:hypothetical protein [Bacteroidota bacterium]